MTRASAAALAASLLLVVGCSGGDDDSATGGPDLTRRIFPVVMSVTDEGTRRLPDEEVGAVVQTVVDERMTNPGG